MDITIHKDLILHLSANEDLNLRIYAITLRGEYLPDSNNILEKFLRQRVKNQGMKEYLEFIHTKLYYVGFYDDYIYDHLREYNKEYDIDKLLDYYFVFDWSKINNGIVKVLNEKSYFNGNRIELEYDLINDTFNGSALDFTVNSSRSWDFVNKWFLLAQEQYKAGLSPQPYNEVKKVQEFLDGKKTIRKYMGNGKEIKTDRLSMSNLFDDRYGDKIDVISLRHGTKHLKVNHEMIRLTMGYYAKEEAV